MIDRRSEPRLLCADFVDVRWKGPAGRPHRAVANLEDISASGVCLQLDEDIPVGTEVHISYPQGAFSGVVRHSHYREIGYFVGVQFEGDSKWDEQDFKPLHLLDPRSLLKKKEEAAASNLPDPPAVS